jgi:hypothetical protein
MQAIVTILGALLTFFSTSLPGRILATLGIGWITYEGYTAYTDQLIYQIQSSWGGIPSDILQVLSLAGIPDGFGLILDAYVTRFSMAAMSHLGRLTP